MGFCIEYIMVDAIVVNLVHTVIRMDKITGVISILKSLTCPDMSAIPVL